jgi:hypothetical protein
LVFVHRLMDPDMSVGLVLIQEKITAHNVIKKIT